MIHQSWEFGKAIKTGFRRASHICAILLILAGKMIIEK